MKHVFETNYSGPAADWCGCQCSECKAALGLPACTPPVQTPEPVRVPPADSALGEYSLPYVFTWSDPDGPCCRRFAELRHLVQFGIGWTRGGGLISMVSRQEFRGSFA